MSAVILVIEDNPASLDLMSYLLSAHGYEPLTACRGDEGLDLARKARPDLVLCDIQLPEMDGYAIARAIKADAALSKVRLVAVTALAMVGDRDRVLSAGFDAYVAKPIDPCTFVAEVEQFLKPEHRSRPHVSATPREHAGHTSPARGTILVVDDSPVNLELMCSLFGPMGYHVLTAASAAAGLALAREYRPRAIISDVGMPGRSGFDLIREIKADPQLQAIPVVVITSTHTDPATRNTALRCGANRFLLRPIDSQQLLHEVESCLTAAHEAQHGDDSGR